MLSPDGHEDLSVDARGGGARIPTLTVGVSKRSLFTSWESGHNDYIYLGTSALRGRHTHVHTCSETAPTCARSRGFSGRPWEDRCSPAIPTMSDTKSLFIDPRAPVQADRPMMTSCSNPRVFPKSVPSCFSGLLAVVLLPGWIHMASSYTSFRYLLDHSSPARLLGLLVIILQRCSCSLLPRTPPVSRASLPEIPLGFLFAVTLLCYSANSMVVGCLLTRASSGPRTGLMCGRGDRHCR